MNDQPILATAVPFLVAKADPPVSDDVEILVPPDWDVQQASNAGWFHTRCGHPRHRDD